MLDFQLYDQDRKLRSLKEFQGKKVVLAFLPGAFTGGCTKEVCTLRDSLASLPGQIVAVSVNDPFTNKAFAGREQAAVSDTERLHERDY